MNPVVFGPIRQARLRGERDTFLGGDGLCALYGLLLCGQRGALMGGVSRDFPEVFGGWFRDNELPLCDLVPRTDNGPFDEVWLDEDQQVCGESVYGSGFNRSNDGYLLLISKFFGPHLAGKNALIFCGNMDGTCSEDLCGYKKQHGLTVTWAVEPLELLGEEMHHGLLCADAVIVSETHAEKVFCQSGREAVLQAAGAAQRPIFLLGEQKLEVICGDLHHTAPLPRAATEADPVKRLGLGAAMAGVVSWGLSRSEHPAACADMAALAAEPFTRQCGVPPGRVAPLFSADRFMHRAGACD